MDLLYTEQQSRVRRFYPGGDLMDFLAHKSRKPEDSQVVQWRCLTGRTSLSTQLSGVPTIHHFICTVLKYRSNSSCCIVDAEKLPFLQTVLGACWLSEWPVIRNSQDSPWWKVLEAGWRPSHYRCSVCCETTHVKSLCL